ncbi:MAG: ATP-binding protein [Candidatus Methanoplasma sp.]|jgi:AAA+ ATPase superfamily predicted ATPase|nr:ATP-binding protein [Candidatus Methanoplasma sp.]
MDAFIGREKELAYLERMYSSGKRQTCAIYGRRRIGKTALIGRFCKGKRTLYIQFFEGTESSNVRAIGDAITDMKGEDPGELRDFLDALKALRRICSEERTVLVFDEYPFLAKCGDYISSALQKFIDHDLRGTDTFLIICGSSIQTMKKEVEDSQAPLFGRFPVRMEIPPLSLTDCRKFHPGMTDMDALKVYMAAGGVPYYHEIMDGGTFEECIKNCFIGPPAPLSDEAVVLIQRELSPSASYLSLLTFMAGGSVTIKELAEKMRISDSLCGRYVRELEFIGMVERIKPMADAPKDTIFRIKDNMLRLHFSVMRRYGSRLKTGDADAVYAEMEQDINSFFGQAFEDVCSEFIQRKFVCRDIGKWWGRGGYADREIDLAVDIREGGNSVLLLCECKFRRRKTDFSVLNRLSDAAGFVKGPNNRRFVLFSVSGFDDDLTEYAEGRKDLMLFGLEDLYR